MSGSQTTGQIFGETQFDILAARSQFPALSKLVNGKSAVFFDGPGGTQVSRRVIDAIAEYYSSSNANSGGAFATSVETDALTERARTYMSDLLGCEPDEIVFGANMTSLTFSLSRAIGRELSEGDEIITTALDHDANVAPWKALEELGVTVHKIDFDPVDCTLQLDQLATLLNHRTKLVAVGYASNAVGTINDVKRIVQISHEVGALVYVDAVHYAPHGAIDVRDIDCDFLACSPYKFFAPHMGVVYGKREHLARLHPYKVRPSENRYPHRWETGTQNFEAYAGLIAAIQYIEDLTKPLSDGETRRARLGRAMNSIRSYERSLSEYFLPKLLGIPGISVFGDIDLDKLDQRTPTFGFNVGCLHPARVCAHLAEEGIFAWDGNFYAVGVTERLGLEATGGMVRVGFVHYNTVQEIDRLIDSLQKLVRVA